MHDDNALPITVEFEATEADHYRAIRAAAARHPGLKWMSLLVLLAPLLMIGLAMANGYTLQQAIFRNLFWLLLAPIFLLVTGPLSLRSQARRASRASAQRPARQIMVFDSQGIRFGFGEDAPELGWHQLRRVVETQDSMLFYVSAREAAYFPLTAIAPAQLTVLRELMRVQLGPDRFESAHA